eukprot:GHUV01011247.1.p1 GENE.GHUV01011247.1~~GHUV01011247.1.p1  ORF type:complete len:243 (+),score=45.63 GHUV01011247.1:111-731(+)
MSVASFEVISQSIQVLVTASQTGVLPVLELGLVMYLVLGSATVLKLVCYLVCNALASKSDSMVALAEDHLNDIMSNMCAIVTAVLAGLVPNGWWIDPVGAVAISMYIVVRWLAIAKQQVRTVTEHVRLGLGGYNDLSWMFGMWCATSLPPAQLVTLCHGWEAGHQLVYGSESGVAVSIARFLGVCFVCIICSVGKCSFMHIAHSSL